MRLLTICILGVLLPLALSAGPPLTLPEYFSMAVEVSLPRYNVTSYGKFFYDQTEQIARIDYYGKKMKKILFDFNKDECLVLRGKGNCTYLSARESFMANPDNSKEMKTPHQLFHLTKDQEYEDLGETTVRGIKASAWSTHVVEKFEKPNLHSQLLRHHHGNNLKSAEYDLTWYFSPPDWRLYHGEKEAECCVPLRAEVKGEIVFVNGTKKEIELTEDIVYFSSDKPSHWKFDIAKWYQCPSREKIQLPSLPESFECAIGMTSLSGGFSSSGYLWFDGANNRLRLSGSKEGKKVTKIFWEDEGMKFKIVEQQCTPKHINKKHDWFGDGKGNLVSPSDLFLFGDNYPLLYLGTRHVRGIECDHWVMNMTRGYSSVEVSFELHWYFSSENWKNKDTGAKRVPIMAEVFGSKKQLKPARRATPEDEDGAIPLIFDIVPSYHELHKQFHHIYEFLHFLPLEPDQCVFDPSHHTTGCEKYGDGSNDHHHHDGGHHKHKDKDRGVSVSALIGIAVTAGVMGIITGVIFFLLFGRWRITRRHHLQIPTN